MYTNPKQWASIRRQILVKGVSLRSVSASERMSRNTVRKILKYEKPPGYDRTTRKRPVPLLKVTRQSPDRKVALSPETQFNTWLGGVEHDGSSAVVTDITQRQLTELLQPKIASFRKKALVVLANQQGFSQRKISVFLGVSVNTVRKYLVAYNQSGIAGLICRTPRVKRCDDQQLCASIFQLLHEPPSLSGINRSIWRLSDLREALAEKGVRVGLDTLRQVIKNAGYRWRCAKVVLTSTDPEYREKLSHIQAILNGLLPTERFFSIDEYGPFSIKMKTGKRLVAPDERPAIPQRQKSKGWLILTAALELSKNQVTHFYSSAKNTSEMIRMIEVLVDEYHDATKLYISWDAASWHMSKTLFSFIKVHNAAAAANNRPFIELAPLPASAQFLNVIESVFSGMARSIIHCSNYDSKKAAIAAINLYFATRNENFKENPHRAGNKIWGQERNPSEFSNSHNCKDPTYR